MKRNEIHFSNSLARDQVAVEKTKLKMEFSFDEIHKEWTMLRDHSEKSRQTTWFTLFSVIALFISFIVMFFIIKFTG